MDTPTLKLETPWEAVKDILMELNTDLTEEDLAYQPGQEDALLERLQQKMNKSKEQLRAWIESASHTSGRAG